MADPGQQRVELHGLTPPFDLAALPLPARVLDRLTAVLMLTDELLGEFQTEDANGMLWLEPHIQRVYDDVDRVMKRLAQ